MSPTFVKPSIRTASFNCPHCGALAHQKWYIARADSTDNESPPSIMTMERIEDLLRDDKLPERSRAAIADRWRELVAGEVFISRSDSTIYANAHFENVFGSVCFSCKRTSLWKYDQLIHPTPSEGPPPNPDLPESIQAEYREAQRVLPLSPRSAAALLRLAIQKLCIHMGQPGKNLNMDIGALVKGGLDSRIQRALDIVRVTGNNAVHPGTMDLHDNVETAEGLFRLVNLIADKLISEPKHIDSLFEALPDASREQILKRDGS